MPAYNAKATIQMSVESVLSQTYHNWELLIINDASNDNTASIIQLLASRDSRIIPLSNHNNQGVAYSRNMAIVVAKGSLLAFLDSDDMWLSNKLEKQVALMISTNAVISYTATSYINAEGQASKFVLHARPILGYKELLRRNIMSCSSVMVKRDAMLSFPQGFMHEDYTVWLKIVEKAGHAHGLDEPLLIYRLGANTKSSNRIKSARMIFGSYREVGYGFIASVLMMLRYAIHSISKRARIRRK